MDGPIPSRDWAASLMLKFVAGGRLPNMYSSHGSSVIGISFCKIMKFTSLNSASIKDSEFSHEVFTIQSYELSIFSLPS